MSPRVLLWCLLAIVGVAACPPSVTSMRDELSGLVQRHGAREVVAGQLRRVERLVADNQDGEATARLAALWPYCNKLVDDRMFRELVATLPGDAIPAELRAVRAVENARQALGAGNDAEARNIALGAVDAPGRTGARAAILVGMVDAKVNPAAARKRLLRVANSRLPGRLGTSLTALARLMAASVDFDAGRYGEALKSYLRVPRGSGYWRTARFGMAWCQHRLERPERTVKILNQMPGGPSEDPEHAILAGMAAHWLGLVSEAKKVVEAALAGADRWDATSVEPEAVLAAIAYEFAEGSEPEDLSPIVRSVAAKPAIMLLGLEMLATREQVWGKGPSDAMGAYLEKLTKTFLRLISREGRSEEARARKAHDQLRVLLPQIVPHPPKSP